MFSLGMILHKIITGQRPLQGGTLTEVLGEVVTREPTIPRQVNPKASRLLDSICPNALDKDAVKRHPTAQQPADDIGRFRKALTTIAHKPTLAERTANWAVRRSALVTGIPLLAIFAGGALHRACAYGRRPE